MPLARTIFLALLACAPCQANIVDIASFGSTSFEVDRAATTAAYSQTTSGIVFGPSISLGDTLGGYFSVPNDWTSFSGLSSSIYLRISPAGSVPAIPVSLELFGAELSQSVLYQGFTNPAAETSGYFQLSLSGPFFPTVLQAVRGAQITWDGASVTTATIEGIGSENPSPTPTPTPEPSPTPVPTPSPTPTPAPSPSPTPAPEPSPTPVPTPSPTPSPTPVPSPTPTPDPTPPPSPTPPPTPAPPPSPTPSPTPSPSPFIEIAFDPSVSRWGDGNGNRFFGTGSSGDPIRTRSNPEEVGNAFAYSVTIPDEGAFVFAFAKEAPTGPSSYDLSTTDLTNRTPLVVSLSGITTPPRYLYYTGGELVSYVVDTNAGTILLEASVVTPAPSTGNPGGNVLRAAFGLVIETSPQPDYRGSVFRSDIFWEDLGPPVDYGMPSTIVAGLSASGEEGALASFTGFFPADFLRESGLGQPSRCMAYREDATGVVALGVNRVVYSATPPRNPFPPSVDGFTLITDEASPFDFRGSGYADTLVATFSNSRWSQANVGIGTATDRREQSIQPFGLISNRTFNDPPFTIEPPTASSGLPVVLTVKSGPALIEGSSVTIVGAGAVTIAANQPGNETFLPAAEVTASFFVEKAPQRLEFRYPGNKKYKKKRRNFELYAVAPAGSVLFRSSKPKVLRVRGKTATIRSKGKVTITAYQPGNANYLPARTSHTIKVR
jgi:hypothetical protein